MQILDLLLLTVLPFIVVLSVVVFVHEFGHFQAARWCKVAVDTFSIGFGKTLLGWRDRNGVEWKIGALPLGGYVKFKDDSDPTSSRPPTVTYTDPAQLEADRKAGLFHAQPVGARAFVVAAGPLTNFLFAILAFAMVGMITGRDVTDYGKIPARIGQVMANSPAAVAGLQPGDIVRTVNGRETANAAAVRAAVMASPEARLTLGVERAGAALTLTMTPRRIEADGKAIGQAGVGFQVLESEKTIEALNPVSAIGHGMQTTWQIIAAHGDFFAKLASPNPPTDQLSGPLGIAEHTGKVVTAAVGGSGGGPLEAAGNLALTLLRWAALISVAVGIVNLLPIPILDGGHLVFYAIEAVRGKRLSEEIQEWSFRAGLVMLLSIFVFATWNDLSRILPNLLPN
jgi:regulator of sigma E protease